MHRLLSETDVLRSFDPEIDRHRVAEVIDRCHTPHRVKIEHSRVLLIAQLPISGSLCQRGSQTNG